MDAFYGLSTYRPKMSHSLGMSGGVVIPEPIPREAIREEGLRLRYRGDDLDDFCQILMGLDRAYLVSECGRIHTGLKSRLTKPEQKR